MDPKETLRTILALCARVEDQKMQGTVLLSTLVELEEDCYNLRRWIARGGFAPEGLQVSEGDLAGSLNQ
jgi:hypothetical protein